MTTTPHPAVDSTTRPCCKGIGGHAHDCHAPAPAHVRITDLDDIDGKYPPIICRADNIASALLESGWFKVQPDLVAPALQRAVLAGQCTDGIERTLGISIEPCTAASAPFLGSEVAAPAGAAEVHPWRDDYGRFYRKFFGTDRDTGVLVFGYQNADGSVEGRWIEIDHTVDGIGSGDARRLAASLLAAADELDALESAGATR